jgi:hypothetical protein
MYQCGGLAALHMKHSPGAPARLTKAQQEQLKNVIVSSTPHEVGFTARHNWTLEIIAAYIARIRTPVLPARCFENDASSRTQLHETDLYVSGCRPGKAASFFRNDLSRFKKRLLNDEIDHLLFEDESMIRDYQAIQKTWFLRGKQRINQTTGKHRGVKLLATVDYATGRIVWQEDEHYTAETFLNFLRKIASAYPTGKIVIVLDNARIRHAKLLQPFLAELNGRLELVFLPPYSPELNIGRALEMAQIQRYQQRVLSHGYRHSQKCRAIHGSHHAMSRLRY